MKKIIRYILAIAALSVAASCKKEIPTWSGSDRISFETKVKTDTLHNYSFVFEAEEVTQYTLWINVGTEGFAHDYPRTVTLKQVPAIDGNENANPGVHFVAFDDPQVQAQYVIPAGASSASIPIILRRDPSLQTSARTLRIVLVENEHFLLSVNKDKLYRNIVFADKLAMPEMWGALGDVTKYFGTYGEVKHFFMIETTGQLFDDEWFEKNFDWNDDDGWQPKDGDYMLFLQTWLQEKLDERNDREGSPLAEKDGAVVDFTINL
jgi:hypothetical protein